MMLEGECIPVIYIMRHSNGLRKLGCSIDVARRRIQLSKSYKTEMELEDCWPHAMGFAIEAVILASLRDHRAKGYQSEEIFKLPLKTMRKAVNDAINNWGKR